MIEWFTRNHVAANLLMLTLLFVGIGSLKLNIPLEVFPSVEPRAVTVSVAVPGTLPEDIETGVTIKIEEAVQDLEGIELLYSRSSENSASITIQIEEGYDPQDFLAEVKNRVDAINTLPTEAERPTVSLAKRLREVITVAVSSNVLSEAEVRSEAERVRDQLLQIDGISQVELDGVQDYEIALEVSESSLRTYGISLSEIAQAISASSRDISAGSLKTSGGEILLRSSGQAYRAEEFAAIPVITRENGAQVLLGELANIRDGFDENRVLTRFNGKTAAMVEVYRIGKESAIDVADKVMSYLEERSSSLSEYVTLTPWRDRSLIVKKRLQTLTNNAIQGGILVLLLLTLFLRPAIAFWVCVGIPVSFMGAFLVMPMLGVTLNILSLFGFIVILGIVVDDAIVTGENIYSHLRRSESGLQAAINGTKEVAVPVTFGILTTIAAFLPIAFIEGVRGQLFAAIPVVVIPILVFSLIESKLILPAHLKHLRIDSRGSRLERWQQAFADGFEAAVMRWYQPTLRSVLRHRYIFLALAVGMLIILSALLSSGWMRFVFFPKVQSEVARLTLTMPTGTAFEVTDRHVVKIAEAARQLQDKYFDIDPDTGERVSVIKNILSVSKDEEGRVNFEIIAPEDRASEISSRELVNEWRNLVGRVPGAESLSYRAEIGRVGDPIDVELQGERFSELSALADKVKQKLRSYPTVYDIQDSFSDGKETLELELTPQAHALGLTRTQILSQVREAFYGYEVQRIQRGRDDIRVMLRYPIEQRSAIASLDQFLVTTASGDKVPLSLLAELKPGQSPASIPRVDRKRVINVTADIDKQQTNMLVLQQELREFIEAERARYPDVSFSLEGEAKEQRESFGSLQWGLLFVAFVIYCLLAIPFKSYLQPFIVMSVIPFGAIGAIGGHWIMGMDLTLISLLGMLALIGVVVNDSLVLVDFVNKRRAEGGELLETVSIAAAARFRPVILTSLTTFLGLMPLLFEKSTQAQFLIPMAVSLGFGILFATVITLLLVPVNYLVIEDLKRGFGKLWSASTRFLLS